jgi:glutamate racemase
VTIPGAEKVIELGLQHVTVFATEQTVKSRTYAERVNILNSDISVTEIALDGGLVTSIEALLPVQRCHTEEDFLKLMELYSSDGWNCTSPEWEMLTSKFFELYVHNSSGGIVL